MISGSQSPLADYVLIDRPPSLNTIVNAPARSTRCWCRCAEFPRAGGSRIDDRAGEGDITRSHDRGRLSTTPSGKQNLARQVVDDLRKHFLRDVLRTWLSEASPFRRLVMSADSRPPRARVAGSGLLQV